MPGNKCADSIFVVQQVIDKQRNMWKKVYSTFVNLEKDYDKVYRHEYGLCKYGVKDGVLSVVNENIAYKWNIQ